MQKRAVVAGIISILVVLLAACGYRPLYGKVPAGRDVASELAAVSIPAPTSRVEQLVRNELVSSFYPPGTVPGSTYKLELTPSVAQPTAVTYPVEGVNRITYRLSVTYRLTDATSGKVLTSGTSRSFVSYDKVHQPVADIQGQADAESRAAREVGEDIRLRIAAYFSRG